MSDKPLTKLARKTLRLIAERDREYRCGNSILITLSKRGLVTGTLVASTDPIKSYRITDAGRKELARQP